MNSTLQRYYSDLRRRNAEIQNERIAECEKKNPKLASLRMERGEIIRALAAGKLTSDQAHSRLAAANAERKNTLIGMGLPANYLDPVYTCPKCRDTGEVGDGLKRLCSCALQKKQETLAVGARVNAKQAFDSFDPAIYPNDTQRGWGTRCKGFCQKYAASLPHPEKPNLLFWGMPGLGKTYFANAIALAALQQGVEARMVTAYRFVQDALEGIERNSDAMRFYTTVPLLVLDDLGTEPMIPNITVETLFRVFNERYVSELPTIVITNLSPEEIRGTYGERLASRLFDSSRTAIVKFSGDTLRTRK